MQQKFKLNPMYELGLSRPDFAWLNPESRLFLQRGYIENGQVAEERIEEIAKYAEKILKMPGFADKFITYMKRGFYSLSSPVWANFGTTKGLSISCVTGETWINTIDGGKMAKDIELGDLVLTHKNRYKPVTNIMPTKSKDDIWRLKVSSRMTDLFITGNHPVLTNLGWVRVDELDPNKHLVAVNGKLQETFSSKNVIIDLAEFADYKIFEKDGRIFKALEPFDAKMQRRYEKQGKEYNQSYSAPLRLLNLDEDLAWFLGLWFADGCVRKQGSGKPNGIAFTLNKRDYTLASRLKTISENVFGLTPTVRELPPAKTRKGEGCIVVEISSIVLGAFFKTFGNGAKEKKIPEWIYTNDDQIVAAFLNGFRQGDGSLKQTGTNVTVSNPVLLLQLYNIGLRLGLDMSLQMQNKASKIATTQYVYTVIFRDYALTKSRSTSKSGIKFSDGLTYCPIVTLEKTEKVEDVWDFTVDEDHSFSCAGVVVHNCYGSFLADDTEEILDTVAEVGIMSKLGGGTSGYFGKIRPRGSAISNGGTTDGSFNFAKLFDTTISTISQGATRRGMMAGYIDVSHGDIHEWLNIHTVGNPIQEMYYGVCVSSQWLEEARNGDKQKQQLWGKILKQRKETGIPYIFFTDNANLQKPDVYKDKNMEIFASNLCLTGDTVVAVADGRNGVTIEQLAKESNGVVKFPVYSSRERTTGKLKGKRGGGSIELTAWNNPEIKNAVAFKTGTKNVVTVVLSNGDTFRCTPDHPLATVQGEWIEAKDAIGAELESFFSYVPEIGSKHRNINSISGANTKQHQKIWEHYHGSVETGFSIDHINPVRDFNDDRISNLQLLTMNEHLEKTRNEMQGSGNMVHRVKDKELNRLRTSEASRGQSNPRFSGIDNFELIELGKMVYEEVGDFNRKIYLSLRDKGFKVPLVFSKYRFGGDFSLYKQYVTGEKTYDGAFDKPKQEIVRSYKTKDELRQEYIDEFFYEHDGENLKRKGLVVVDVIDLGETEDVYDLTVDDNHNFFILTSAEDERFENAQGVLVHNCSEIMLPSSTEESFVCCLASMNALYFEEWKNTDAVKILTYFLDAMITDFVQKTKKYKHMHKARRFAERHRALGVGVLGWHSFLQSQMIPFVSEKASEKTEELFGFLQAETLQASKELAELLGEPEILKGYGRRNATLMALAPTKSSSFILGSVSPSIEPLTSNYYVKDLAKIKSIFKNPYLEKLLDEKGKNTEEVWESILKFDGSVQHLDFLSDFEKDVFKTFVEIDVDGLIEQAALRQKYIDQGQSLNVMINPKTDPKEINRLYLKMHDLGLKSVYYQKGMNAAQVQNREKLQQTLVKPKDLSQETCSSCEA